MPPTPPRPLLLILALYLLLGGLYAFFTPLWQTPDEPAHFNYVRQVAESGRLPVLQPGDYDQAYLEQMKAAEFPPALSIDSIRYEGHQPPLYYVLAAPIYRLAQGLGLAGQARVLRLLGVVLGAGVVALIWASLRRLFPAQPAWAVWAAGFAAALPMHTAMMASINNDPLAELLVAAGMYRLLGHLQKAASGWRTWLGTGVIIGLALLAKFQAYVLLPLAAAVGLWQLWEARRQRSLAPDLRPPPSDLRSPALALLAGLLPALLLPLPWWLRNLSVYGAGDPLGLNRHNAIVTGQPRTADWIASQGWAAYLERLVEFTFQSFWGVFGWLGVFLDSRIYAALAALTGLLAVGLLWQVWTFRPSAQPNALLSPFQRRGLILLGLQMMGVILAYAWYNLTFVQHQGRYLFPALLPLALLFALGVEGLLSPQGSRLGAAAALVWAFGVVVTGFARGDVAVWLVGLCVAASAALAASGRRRMAPAAAALLVALVALVALQALFGAIVPQLAY